MARDLNEEPRPPLWVSLVVWGVLILLGVAIFLLSICVALLVNQ